MRIGIIFGGRSREREISFAGGRTVYDNLNKSLFTPVPLFADSFGNFILLDWQYVYKGSIRDFYPPANAFTPTKNGFQIYAESLGNGQLTEAQHAEIIAELGTKVSPDELKNHIDFAFLTLHGAYGEDGTIQGMLQYLGIPYTASGILPSAIGMDKAFQKVVMQGAGFNTPKYQIIQRDDWVNTSADKRQHTFEEIKTNVGIPCVTKAANQGSSIGIGRLMDDDFEVFEEMMNRSFFLEKLSKKQWRTMDAEAQLQYIKNQADIRSGLGLPLLVHDTGSTANKQWCYHPDDLLLVIQQHFNHQAHDLLLEASDKESEVLVEGFLSGKEFSCIVLRDEDGTPIALPPTEIRKGKEIYDYRSKYLAGLSSKITPIDLPNNQIQNIRGECVRLFNFLKFHTYARIDGFINEEGTIFLNDPNTTSGMLPSSFFFHQAAEIGLNPSEFLSFIIRSSLHERIKSTTNSSTYEKLLRQLDKNLAQLHEQNTSKKRIGVILGGYSSERHISVESGRNVYEKLASSNKYVPIPIFLKGNSEGYELYEIPINVLLKDNADDIRDKIADFKHHPIVKGIKDEAGKLIQKYRSSGTIDAPELLSLADLSKKVDAVFIALHGRPGEDGSLQKELKQYNIPYNGSNPHSSEITIDKYATLQLLQQHGFKVAKQLLVQKADWQQNQIAFIATIEAQFPYPFITKPSDDGCSSAVKKIKNQAELQAFAALMFRPEEDFMDEQHVQTLDLKPKEEFPVKNYFLVEELIEQGDADHFLEITGGLLTHRSNGSINYEMFEPSEALAGEDVLSLEEKFLAGQGQNITPARYASDPAERNRIAKKVMDDLQKVAKILDIEGYARIDAFVKIYNSGKVETYVIEANSLPGMTPATCIFHQTALNGYTPFQFIDQILEYGMAEEEV